MGWNIQSVERKNVNQEFYIYQNYLSKLGDIKTSSEKQKLKEFDATRTSDKTC